MKKPLIDLTEETLDDQLADIESRLSEIEEIITRILLTKPVKEA